MTVKELKEKLDKFPDDVIICIPNDITASGVSMAKEVEALDKAKIIIY